MTEKEIAVLALLYGKLEEVDLEKINLNQVDVNDIYDELTATSNSLYQRYFDTEDKQLEDLYLEIIETIDILLSTVGDPSRDLQDPEEDSEN